MIIILLWIYDNGIKFYIIPMIILLIILKNLNILLLTISFYKYL